MVIEFDSEIPVFGKNGKSFGFIEGDMIFPARRVSTEKLFYAKGAVCVSEEDGTCFEQYHPGATNYDFGGMIFRVELPKGAYDLEVDCMGEAEGTLVSVCGMNPERILQGGFWDAAKKVPVRSHACWQGSTWCFSMVNGGACLDIALEPRFAGQVIGLKQVRILPHREREAKREKPTIFILGDSTAKSYVFEEAPMSGWGQLFYRMVDPERASVINYSNGGRSLRVMYNEGRFNDMLLYGQEGDIVLLQSGHNDERARNDGVDPDGEESRFGRGSTEEQYQNLLERVFLPAIRARGMLPVLVTPVTRINAECGDDTIFCNSFRVRNFPEAMRRAAAHTAVTLLDLNQKSVEHFNQIGPLAAKAMVMAIEPGETPGKTNGGSYANGNPGNHADGTHYKECLSREYCRMAVEEILRTKAEGDETAGLLWSLLREEVREAALKGDFAHIFPEVCRDTISGRGAYYRNQIEKLVQLGVFSKDSEGNFNPFQPCERAVFKRGIQKLWKLPPDFAEEGGEDDRLLRQDAAEILYDAYMLRFGPKETDRPRYMTDYNGRTIDPQDPNYDINLPDGETVYYPLTGFERLQDLDGLTKERCLMVEAVYKLGIMRCEAGIRRGSLQNGTLFEPNETITREKAAKLLYFCFVLGQDVGKENHEV